MSGVAAPCSEPAARRKLTIFRTAASSGWIEAESDECRWVQVDVSQACLVPRTAKRGRDVLDWLASVTGQGAGKRELKPELDRSAGRVCRGIQIVDFVCYWPADDEKLRRGPDESAHRVVDRRHPFRLREGTFDDRSCPVGIRSNHVRLWIVSAAHGVRHDEVEVLMEKECVIALERSSSHSLLAMMFGAFGNPDHDASIEIIPRAWDAGINFIDTADGYSAGESEEIVGKALAGGRRENVVLAVKFGPPFGEDPNHRGASRRWITEGVEGSLRRLQTDWIDLYQVGVPDPNTDIDETLSALTDLVQAGKNRSFGASKVPASEIVEAQWTAERRGHGRFRTEQPPYSLLTRAIEYDVLPTCLRHGMGVMTYSPLAGGWLSGKYRKGQEVSGPGSAARAQRSGAYDSTNPAMPQSSTPPTPSAPSPTRP